MIRFSHTANSWQALAQVTKKTGAWMNISADEARYAIGMDSKFWHFITMEKLT